MNFRQWTEAAAEYNPYAFHAIILAGGPGSGKSRVGRTIAGAFGFNISDSDRLLELMAAHRKEEYLLGLTSGQPGYDQKMSNTNKAVELNVKRTALWRQQGIPYIVDITGRDVGLVSKIKEELEQEGYDVFMVFINTPLETARKRNKGRSRIVDDDFLVDAWNKSRKSISAYINIFGKKFLMIDNDDDINNRASLPAVEARIPRMMTHLLTPNQIENPIGEKKLQDMKGKPINQISTDKPLPQVANVGLY